MTDIVEQIARGVYLLHSSVGGRPLHLSLLVGSQTTVLIDSGCASDVQRTIQQGFHQLRLPIAELSAVINTHCDVDHQGGNAGVLNLAPNAELLCGKLDQAEIESPEIILKMRYDAYRSEHNIFYDETDTAWLRRELGSPCTVDRTFHGGETFRLAPDWEIEILHLPGHSRGHLGIWDHKNNILFGGDAIQGGGYLNLSGGFALCPTYLYIADYLETVKRVERCQPGIYVGCHWPICYGMDQVSAFCRASSRFVHDTEQHLLAHLKASPNGASLKELCTALAPRLGHWPAKAHMELCYAINGHLDDLENRALVGTIPGPSLRFRAL